MDLELFSVVVVSTFSNAPNWRGDSSNWELFSHLISGTAFEEWVEFMLVKNYSILYGPLEMFLVESQWTKVFVGKSYRVAHSRNVVKSLAIHNPFNLVFKDN